MILHAHIIEGMIDTFCNPKKKNKKKDGTDAERKRR